MRDGYTHISVVLDRSGSMSCCQQATKEGFNKFLTDQKELKGDATFTLVQFDDRYEVNYDFKDVKEIPYLNDETYQPRGGTALLDAIAKTINSTGKALANMPESQRPSRVIFVIQTDGEENSSTEFNRKQVFDMVTHQREKYDWHFVFLGANQDAIATAAQYGIGSSTTLTYSSNQVRTGMAILSHFTSGVRCAADSLMARSCCFSDADRVAAVGGAGNFTTTATSVLPNVTNVNISATANIEPDKKTNKKVTQKK